VDRRVIAHIDCDAFYAAVELRRRPELRGRCVIVSGSGPRAVVTTASYEARRFGVHSAMPTSRARRLCPQAVLIPPDFAAYRDASREVWDIVREHVGGERLEQVGLDEAYLDLTDLVIPKAAMRRLAAEVKGRTGLTISVGIGPNKLVAKVASDCEKPEGLVALSLEMACARFAASSPRLIPGIGPRTAERLVQMGIDTLAQLREVDPQVLVERFGANHGLDLHRRARFEGGGRVQPVREAVSRSNETTFDTDIVERELMEEVLTRLAAELCRGLRRRDTRGRTIAIKVRLADFTTISRARTVEKPTNDPGVVTRVACELLRAYDPPQPVRLLGVRVAAFAALEDGVAAQLRLPVEDPGCGVGVQTG
jgi:DNA polymerase IV